MIPPLMIFWAGERKEVSPKAGGMCPNNANKNVYGDKENRQNMHNLRL